MPKSSRRKSSPARRGRSAQRRTRSQSTASAHRRKRSSGKASKKVATRRPRRSVKPARQGAPDRAFRDLLIAQLEGGHAHATFAQAIADFPVAQRGVRPEGVAHSPWQVLEHLRISQWDIVEFTRDPQHRSPGWPAGYWPSAETPPSDSAWQESVSEFERELEVMTELLRDPRRELFTQVDHPEAKPHHTLAREAMVLAVHNGYHIAELIMLRRLLGVWPSS